jgi:hypothetical protein
MVLMAAMVNKKVWHNNKFNEVLLFSEDKEWSARVIKRGMKLEM